MLPDGSAHMASDNLNAACSDNEGDTAPPDGGLPERIAPGLEVRHPAVLTIVLIPRPAIFVAVQSQCTPRDADQSEVLQVVSVADCESVGRAGIQHLLHGPVTSRSLVEINHSRIRGIGIGLNPRVIGVEFHSSVSLAVVCCAAMHASVSSCEEAYGCPRMRAGCSAAAAGDGLRHDLQCDHPAAGWLATAHCQHEPVHPAVEGDHLS
jgi:hypothetical protein